MLTGKEALSRIDVAIGEAQEDSRGVATRLEGATRREMVLREEERVCYADLARFRIDLAIRDRVTDALEEAGRQVGALLERREAARVALEKEIADTEEKLSGFRERRAAAAEELESLSARLDEAEAGVQEKLRSDSDYEAQFNTAETSQKIVDEAEQKRALTQEDRKEKGEPYESDPLFMYLWDRGYGTSDYKSGGLIRWLDGWVARLISYEGARRNYFMLLEIPKRLKDHVEAMRTKADADLEALVALEEAARAASDVPELESDHKAQRETLDGIDADIGELESKLQELGESRTAFHNGTDEHFSQAVEAVSREIRDDSLAHLKRAAYLTPDPEDERIVERLQRIDNESDDIAHSKSELSELQASADERVRELQDMRREFQRKRYDDYTSEFDDGDLFGKLLREFVRGALTGAAYWDQLDRHHKRRTRKSKPDFGSGRFRFPGPTTFPGSRSGGSSGGFGTGGGFGGGSSGGGFRTGGGF